MMHSTIIFLSVLVLLVSSKTLYAQNVTCDRKLSELEADVASIGAMLDAAWNSVARVSDGLSRDAEATISSAECPAKIDASLLKHRDDLSIVDANDLFIRAEANLICAQFFGARVTEDLRLAQIGADSRMVIRLGLVADRIVGIDRDATRDAIKGTALMTKIERLNREMEDINGRCNAFSDIYD